MIAFFLVEKVSNLRHRLFKPDPNDPTNTVDTGQFIQELTLEIIPDQLKGGKGLLVLQLNDADNVGRFQPGDKVKAEFTVVEG